MHFTQFYASPIYLNPAFTGANVCARASMTYRNQWPEITKTYRSFLFSLDHDLQIHNLGIGGIIGRDVAGSANLSTTIFYPSVSHMIKLTPELMVRFGLQVGMMHRNVDFKSFLFGDQLVRGGNVATIEDPTKPRTFVDINTGSVIYSSMFWLGVSFSHLTTPNQALFENGNSELPLKYSVHGGTKFELDVEEIDDGYTRSISPAFNYRGQKDFDQLDIGLYYAQQMLIAGLWYRGIPVFKSYQDGYANNDALALLIGIQTKRYSVGYSFDITISRLTTLTSGAHEISLSHQFCVLRKKKKKYQMVMPCPKF